MRPSRLAFAAYALALFVATHWPSLQVPKPGGTRVDLWAHFAAFAGWTALLIAAAPFGGRAAAERLRTPAVVGCWLIALLYAAIDESLQALPILKRHASLDDYAADALGITAAALGAVALRRLLKRPGEPAARPAEDAARA